jgi:hypothetical protein
MFLHVNSFLLKICCFSQVKFARYIISVYTFANETWNLYPVEALFLCDTGPKASRKWRIFPELPGTQLLTNSTARKRKKTENTQRQIRRDYHYLIMTAGGYLYKLKYTLQKITLVSVFFRLWTALCTGVKIAAFSYLDRTSRGE